MGEGHGRSLEWGKWRGSGKIGPGTEVMGEWRPWLGGGGKAGIGADLSNNGAVGRVPEGDRRGWLGPVFTWAVMKAREQGSGMQLGPVPHQPGPRDEPGEAGRRPPGLRERPALLPGGECRRSWHTAG